MAGLAYGSQMTATTLLDLGDEPFVLLTTFRRSGKRVSTPVWVARDGDHLVVITPAGTGKVKRIAANPAVEVTPCDRRGRPKPWATTVAGRAEVRDVVGRPPDEAADLALILKTLPCLEAIDRRAPERLLDAIAAPRLLVSFPAQSLGGRRKGMAAHYEAQFRRLLDARGWPAERFAFATELAFLVEKK